MPISNTDKYIDGRDFAQEIDAIREDIEWHESEITKRKTDNKCTERFESGLCELKEMLAPMVELQDDIYSTPMCDVSLVAADEFENYCRRFAFDCGELTEDSSVEPFVDWERYADAVRIDFKTVDYDGEEYLYRA